LASVHTADLKEEIKQQIGLRDEHTFEITCRPHEIVTLMLKIDRSFTTVPQDSVHKVKPR
jgi:hypothetical protein